MRSEHVRIWFRVARAAAILAVVVLALTVLSRYLRERLFLNLSPSMERGIYLATDGQITYSSLGIATLPDEIQRPNALKTKSVLKKVSGLKGDSFCRAGDFVVGASLKLPIQRTDSEGTPLHSITGCVTLKDDEVFLVGEGESFDSRYFGPISTSHVKGVVRPLFVWGSK